MHIFLPFLSQEKHNLMNAPENLWRENNKSTDLTQNNCLHEMAHKYKGAKVLIIEIYCLLVEKKLDCSGRRGTVGCQIKRALHWSLCKSYCVKCGYIRTLCWVCVSEPPTLPGESLCGLSLSDVRTGKVCQSFDEMLREGCGEGGGGCAL